ncbi:hypothetical protein DPMN_173488 [Dreissena polymorpha]|uniref:Uncharacterized protein n=1 Tax=Dreissena polymorpha TaxID=45954 RepID=A0A9D4E1Q3_DREPO|nr:hypothetical protein DPMN_173488 [Dreissena polymorpha]
MKPQNSKIGMTNWPELERSICASLNDVLNPTDTVVEVRQDAVIAHAEIIERILCLVSQTENADKQPDCPNIRQIQVDK